MERLDKVLSASGYYTRSEARNAIKAGLVLVDGAALTDPGVKIDPDGSRVIAEGRNLGKARDRYFLLNKPEGLLTATRDAAQKTVLDLFPPDLRRLGLIPAGRLDKDTTGLLILTTSGDYVHRLISPKKHVPKVYRAKVDGKLGEEDIAAFAAGLVLGDGTECLPAHLTLQAESFCLVKVYEGKYHQVKRMLASRGAPVLTLHRCSIGCLTIPEGLESGQYAELTEEQAFLALRDPEEENS